MSVNDWIIWCLVRCVLVVEPPVPVPVGAVYLSVDGAVVVSHGVDPQHSNYWRTINPSLTCRWPQGGQELGARRSHDDLST